MPRFLQAFLAKYPLHAIQGPGEDAERLEAMAAELGWRPEEVNNYDLMVMDRPPPALGGGGPPGLLLRRARREDAEGLFPLQAAYEQEEVLPRGAFFDPAVCRLNLDRILAGEQVLAAEINGRMVGKINTNAASFSRTQIGGVYVRPEYRGRGIALRMAHAFARELIAEGRGLSLFVKKRNAPARAIYRRIGFEAIGDYRISYY
jgi:ribosomal protein S18 acetylase RimI-like enzyme